MKKIINTTILSICLLIFPLNVLKATESEEGINFFNSENSVNSTDPEGHDAGDDTPSAPIDDYLFALIILGSLGGFYFIKNLNKQPESK